MRATWSEAGSRANWVDGVAIDVDGQAAAQVGKGEVAGRVPAPVAEKWQKIPKPCRKSRRRVGHDEGQVTTCREDVCMAKQERGAVSEIAYCKLRHGMGIGPLILEIKVVFLKL